MQTSQSKTETPSYKNSTTESKLLVIDRRFDVPVEKLFNSFASSDEIKVWWWPQGMYADQVEWEFKNGGRYFINMKGYEKGGGGMTGQFKEIVPNKLLVMTDKFADEKGNAISAEEADMPGKWPEEAFITFEFEAINDHSSRFKLSQQGIPNELQKDCIQGWMESFDKLEIHLGHKH